MSLVLASSTTTPVGVDFGEEFGAVTTPCRLVGSMLVNAWMSAPEPTAAPLLFGNEEGEAERVAASESVVMTTVSTTTTTSTVGVNFGESAGEVEDMESSGPGVLYDEIWICSSCG